MGDVQENHGAGGSGANVPAFVFPAFSSCSYVMAKRVALV